MGGQVGCYSCECVKEPEFDDNLEHMGSETVGGKRSDMTPQKWKGPGIEHTS